MTKTVIWYSSGTFFYLLLVALMPARMEVVVKIIFAYFFFTLGLLIGWHYKSLFCEKPWLLVFIPLLQFIIYLIVGTIFPMLTI
jgi:apolipoprotein N-acyltransferase